MSWFGADTAKPMQLFSNASWIGELAAYRVRGSGAGSSLGTLAPRHEDPVTGELRPRGGPGVKTSQAYTPQFGNAIADLWTKHRRQWRCTPAVDAKACCCNGACPDAMSLLTSWPHATDLWVDAGLQALLQSLRQQACALAPSTLTDVVSVDSD